MTGTAPDFQAAGRLIGERRRALGLPKNEAARQARLSNTTWRLIEAGANHNPTDETLVRIARVIQIEPELVLQAWGRGGASPRTGDEETRAGNERAAGGPTTTLPPLPITLPPTRTPYFTGRDDSLGDIANHLETWTGRVVPLVISGFAGVGKTTLAREYLVRNRGAYEDVWWIQLDEPGARRRGFDRLAAKLGIAGPGREPVEGGGDGRGDGRGDGEAGFASHLLSSLVASGRRWLVVLDGADSATDVERFLPDVRDRSTAGVRLMLTSRQGAGWHLAKTLPLGPLSIGDAVQFLRRRSGYEGAEVTEARQARAAEALAEELGCLPLALERAGSYVDDTGISLATFLDLVRELVRSDRLTELLDPGSGGPGWDPLAGLDRIRPHAPDLLRLLAFLAPDPISPAHLTRHAGLLPAPLSGELQTGLLGIGTAVGALRRRSLVTLDANGLHVHRLIQASVRRSLTDAERTRWAAAALGVLDEAFPTPDGGAATQATGDELLPHARAVVGHARLNGVGGQVGGRLLGRVAEHCRLAGRLVPARRLAEEAIGLLGADDPDAIPVHTTLALVLIDLGDVWTARRELGRARGLAGGRDRLDPATALLDAVHAATEAHIGQYDDAVAGLGPVCDYLVALPAASRTVETAAVMTAVGTALRLLDDVDKARVWHGEALAIRRASHLSSLQYDAGLDCYGLAAIELRRGRMHRAAYWYEEGLEIYGALYGDAPHPRLGDGWRGLAVVKRRIGDVDGARAELVKARRAYAIAYGDGGDAEREAGGRQAPDHPALRAVDNQLELLGDLLAAGGAKRTEPVVTRADATRRYGERLLAIGNRARGFENDAEAVTALRLGHHLLGHHGVERREIEESIASFERSTSLAGAESLVGLQARLSMGQALERLNDVAGALEAYRAIIDATDPGPGSGGRGAGRGVNGRHPSGPERIRALAEARVRELAAADGTGALAAT